MIYVVLAISAVVALIVFGAGWVLGASTRSHEEELPEPSSVELIDADPGAELGSIPWLCAAIRSRVPYGTDVLFIRRDAARLPRGSWNVTIEVGTAEGAPDA